MQHTTRMILLGGERCTFPKMEGQRTKSPTNRDHAQAHRAALQTSISLPNLTSTTPNLTRYFPFLLRVLAPWGGVTDLLVFSEFRLVPDNATTGMSDAPARNRVFVGGISWKVL